MAYKEPEKARETEPGKTGNSALERGRDPADGRGNAKHGEQPDAGAAKPYRYRDWASI